MQVQMQVQGQCYETIITRNTLFLSSLSEYWHLASTPFALQCPSDELGTTVVPSSPDIKASPIRIRQSRVRG